MPWAAVTDPFTVGARIGDYRVDDELAHDASATVYLATHVVLPRRARLKVCRGTSRSAAVRLLREACILEALSHAGIPRVHECGVLPDRRPWAAIERTPGVTLERLGDDGALSLLDVVVALRDVADILRHAHERGVVHRRLTAGTIVRIQHPHTSHVIGDWAEACALDTEADVAVDPRDDIGALGGIVHRALTRGSPEPLLVASHPCPDAQGELQALVDQMRAEPVARPVAEEIYDRAVWLCDALGIAPRAPRPRWTPTQVDVSKATSSDRDDGFAVRIARSRTSDPG